MCKKIKLKRDGWFPSEWITSKFSLIIKFIFFQIHYINSNYILDPVFYYITTVYNKSLCSSGIYVWKVDNTGSKIVIQVLLAFFFNRLKIHKLSSSKLYHQSYIHGIFQERRAIPACLFFFTHFLSSHGKGGWWQRSTTAPNRNSLGSFHPYQEQQVSVYWVPWQSTLYLYEARHSILLSVSSGGATKSNRAFHLLCFFCIFSHIIVPGLFVSYLGLPDGLTGLC